LTNSPTYCLVGGMIRCPIARRHSTRCWGSNRLLRSYSFDRRSAPSPAIPIRLKTRRLSGPFQFARRASTGCGLGSGSLGGQPVGCDGWRDQGGKPGLASSVLAAVAVDRRAPELREMGTSSRGPDDRSDRRGASDAVRSAGRGLRVAGAVMEPRPGSASPPYHSQRQHEGCRRIVTKNLPSPPNRGILPCHRG
jgi:hypothetical protein